MTKTIAIETVLRSWKTAAGDPGVAWVKDSAAALDAPPDAESLPDPAARWPASAPRTGVGGVVTPRVVPAAGGGYRMYYTQILPRPGFPAGANDYANAASRILSAWSADGMLWKPEEGVRLDGRQGGEGAIRVVSPDLAPTADGTRRLRMYFECCYAAADRPSVVRSAVSVDGLAWAVEAGIRLGASGRHFISPRIMPLGGKRFRLYCGERGRGIISALSEDGGSSFREEPGLRMGRDLGGAGRVVFAPEVLRIAGGGYRAYFAAYSEPNRASIHAALSDDGLRWRENAAAAVAPGGTWDRVKCSEMCVIELPGGKGRAQRYRMYYEACDGTAGKERGVWRIAAADSLVGEEGIPS